MCMEGEMVPRAGFEPAAYRLGGDRSIRLSYRGSLVITYPRWGFTIRRAHVDDRVVGQVMPACMDVCLPRLEGTPTHTGFANIKKRRATLGCETPPADAVCNVLITHRLGSWASPEQALKRYVHLYNQDLPQRALGRIAPSNTMANRYTGWL